MDIRQMPWALLGDIDQHELRALNGKTRIPFRWEPPHRVDGQSPVSLVWPYSSRFPVSRSTTAIAQPFQVTAVTTGEDTRRLLDLLEAGYPVGLYHSLFVCDIEDCDIPEFEVVYVDSFVRSRTDRTDVQSTRWELSLVPADPAYVEVPPGAPWSDLLADQDAWGAINTGVWEDLL
ncbi:hypothetical protein [Flaviflexus equikiangi]|uniref:DUF402 domain-containing protein n=1 Tax=Flaviflexus equikiangi TaxID=2758573 RepID=A0ABS2TCG9_9ACTO|nr:hypothetical protein [Flaviflexus equikiangi]MBM9432334.1 hypothetical protein [Flaviflexus equikiangi]